MDMIPGRVNRLSLLATKPGTYRGPCAEYCGTSHALMAFTAVVMEPEAFRQWLAAQVDCLRPACRRRAAIFSCATAAAPAIASPAPKRMARSARISRMSARAIRSAPAFCPSTKRRSRSFIAHPHLIKPGSKMPAFAMLPEQDIAEIAAWLKGLE